MAKRLEIYIPCKESECLLMEDPSFDVVTKQLKEDGLIDVSVTKYENNRDGMSKNYNKTLNEIRNREESKKPDFVSFMHSDVRFYDFKNCLKHLIEASNKYNIIGVAGTKKINLKISPLTWFTGSNPTPEKRYGHIISKFMNQEIPSFFNDHDPTKLDESVSAIDGLCMFLDRKTIESGICFDETFSTDFYDLDFCLTAILKHKLKIGVMVEKTYHQSVGMSVLTEKFLGIESKFREKWDCKL